MPDLRPNGAYASQPDVALVHTVYGDRVDQTVRPNTTDTDVAQLPNAHFREYREPPPPRPRKRPCAVEGCRSYNTVGDTGHCVGHARSLGLIPNWSRKGRKHEPD